MRTLFGTALFLVATYVQVHPAFAAEDSKLEWNSPKVLEIRKELEAWTRLLGRPQRSNYWQKEDKISDLLRKRLSHKEMSGLASTCGALPVDEDKWDYFQYHLILEMVSVLLDAGDRDSLVTLSRRDFRLRTVLWILRSSWFRMAGRFETPYWFCATLTRNAGYRRCGCKLQKPFVALSRDLAFVATMTPILSRRRASGTSKKRASSFSIPSIAGTGNRGSLMLIGRSLCLSGRHRLQTLIPRGRAKARQVPRRQLFRPSPQGPL